MAPTTEPKAERVVSVRVELPESLHEAVKNKARREDRTMASAIRHVLREWSGAF